MCSIHLNIEYMYL